MTTWEFFGMCGLIIASLTSINSWFNNRDIKAMELELRDLRAEVERLNQLGSDEYMLLDQLRNRVWRLENPQNEVSDEPTI